MTTAVSGSSTPASVSPSRKPATRSWEVSSDRGGASTANSRCPRATSLRASLRALARFSGTIVSTGSRAWLTQAARPPASWKALRIEASRMFSARLDGRVPTKMIARTRWARSEAAKSISRC